MKFIKLNLHGGKAIYFSVSQISAFYPHSSKGTVIKLSNGDEIPVEQTHEEVKESIVS